MKNIIFKRAYFAKIKLCTKIKSIAFGMNSKVLLLRTEILSSRSVFRIRIEYHRIMYRDMISIKRLR